MGKVIPIVKGGHVMSLREVRPASRWGTPLRKGVYRKVNTVRGDEVQFVAYGDWYPKSAFVGVTATARLEATLAAKKALVVRAQAAVVVAEKALADALNPPTKVGDTVKIARPGGAANTYKLLYDDGEAIVLGLDKKRFTGTRTANSTWFPLVRAN